MSRHEASVANRRPEVLDRSTPPAPGPLHSFEFPHTEHRVLSNGMRVLVAESRRHPIVTCSIVLRVGGSVEGESLGGVALLTGSLLESGAAGRSAAEIAETLENLGVRLDTGVSWDATHVGLTSLASRTLAAIPVLADLVRRPDFPLAEVERLRNKRLAEIAQRRADPRSLASEMAVRYIFPDGEPFSRPLGGTPQTVRRLTREDVAAFHARNYSPAAATVLIVGDIAIEPAIENLERHFGDWSGTSALHGSQPAEQPGTADARVVIVDRPGAVQSEIRVGHMGVARHSPDYFALVVMNTILGGAFSSRLNLNLRERHGYTYGARSAFALRRRPGPFMVSTAVQTEVTAAAVTEIHREIRRIRESTVEPQEFEDARNYLAGVFPVQMQTTDSLAAHLAELVVYDLPAEYWDTYRDRVLGVEVDDVLRVAVECLHPESLATIVVGDASRILRSLESAEVGPVEVVSPGSLDDGSAS